MYNINNGLLEYISNNFLTEAWQIQALFLSFVVVSIAAAYLLGSVNSAIIISKVFYRDDIRKYGSGNAGLTNMLRTYGKKAALFTLIGDILKTALAIAVAGILLGFHYQHGMSLDDGYCYMAGLFAVLGHVFPIYYGFKGGKGVLATATMALILTPIPFAILILLFIAIVYMSRYVSLGSVVAAVLYPVLVNGYIRFTTGSAAPGILSLCTIILAIFIVWCHRGNLARISQRTERKISFGGGKKEKIEEEKNAEGSEDSVDNEESESADGGENNE